jgi:xylulokinase
MSAAAASGRFVIGLDSGTQGAKALVIDYDEGRVLGRGWAAHAMRSGLAPGESEQDPKTWVAAMEAALGEALKQARIRPADVVAMGVSGQQHGFVPLDSAGHPIRPAKLWNDTSTVEETNWLTNNLGGRRLFIEKLGVSLAVGYTASKILWLKRNEPENFQKLATVLLPHDYLNYHLTGKAGMEYGDASGTGLMDIRKREWHPEALAAIDPGLGEMLPPLHHSAEPHGRLKEEVGGRFGLSRVLVSSGGGDNMMAAIGTGNVVPGVCTLSLGTSGTIYSYFRRPFIDPEGEIAAFCDSTGGWLPLLCTMNVTNASELFKAAFRLSNADLESLASEAPAGADGLLFLPFIDGERVPVLPMSSAVYFGLNRKTFTPRHMARALIEGTVFNLGYGLARMRSLGLSPAEIRATGGGATSKLWLQVAADVLQTPVEALEEQEAAAFGAGLQAVWCHLRENGEDVSIAEVVKARVRLAGKTIKPSPLNSRLYSELQARFNSLWKSLEKEFRQHRKVSFPGSSDPES